jgi:hypothetical protein
MAIGVNRLYLGGCFPATRTAVAHTSETIRQAEHAYKELRKNHLAAKEDEHTIEQLDPGGKIRAELEGEGQKTTDESSH